jgi:hypothetical protein
MRRNVNEGLERSMSGRRASESGLNSKKRMCVFVNESLACEESLVVWSGVKMGSLWKKRVPRRGSVDYISRGGETLSFLGRVSELWATWDGHCRTVGGPKSERIDGQD